MSDMPPKSKPLAKYDQNKTGHIVSTSSDELASGPSMVGAFFDLDAIEEALGVTQYTVFEEIETLVQVLRDAMKVGDFGSVLRAQNQLRKLISQSAELNGLFVRRQQTSVFQGSSGDVHRISQQQTRLLDTLRDRNDSRKAVADAPYKAGIKPPVESARGLSVGLPIDAEFEVLEPRDDSGGTRQTSSRDSRSTVDEPTSDVSGTEPVATDVVHGGSPPSGE